MVDESGLASVAVLAVGTRKDPLVRVLPQVAHQRELPEALDAYRTLDFVPSGGVHLQVVMQDGFVVQQLGLGLGREVTQGTAQLSFNLRRVDQFL